MNQDTERDRWWMERAEAFCIDSRAINGKPEPVYIMRETDQSNTWIVSWHGRILANREWVYEYGDTFRDRETALAAYEQWKQQEEQG